MIFQRFLLVSTLALFIAPQSLISQEKTITYNLDPASNPPDLIVSLKHVKADLSFRPAGNLVIGNAELTIVPNRYKTDSIIVYTPDFIISKVSLSAIDPGSSGKREWEIPVSYKLLGPNLVIYPPASDETHAVIKGNTYLIRIAYEAKPLAGPIYFIGWKPEEEGKRKEIWAHRPHNWLPYIEARVTTDMYIRFDGRYKVFSNGERLGVITNQDGTKTWHYAMKKDHPYFSTSLVIGDYDYRKSATSTGIPLEFWYYSGMADRVSTTYKYTERMFDFLEKEIGVSYPYPLYREAPVIDYMYGAMETTTATVFGDYMLIDPHAWWQRNYVNVNAHELAHQWFGNCIAHLVNKDVWLTESFATYYAKMFERSVYGEDYYQNLRKDEMDVTFEAAKKNDCPVGGSQGGVQRIYQKGSLVLGMLRDIMGEKEFRDAVKTYVLRYSFNYAQTSDFIRATYDVTGRPLQWFFEEWILHGGEPDYRISYAPVKDSSGRNYTEFQVAQIQEITELKGVFKMPVRFEVFYKNGSCDSLLAWIDKKEQSVRVPNTSGQEVEYVLFDPGRRILKQVSFKRSFEELSAQLIKAKNMIDRYDALVALKDIPLEIKKNLLIQSFQKEKFHLMLKGILEQLSKDHSYQSMEVFRKALLNPDANVRRTALQLLDTIPSSLRKEAEDCLDDSSYMNIELALEKLSRSFGSGTDHYLELTKDMEGWRGENIRIAWLEIAIRNGKHEFLKELISYTGPKYEFETRMNSLSALQRLGYIDPVTTENARNASRHWNNKLSAAALEYLNFFNVEH